MVTNNTEKLFTDHNAHKFPISVKGIIYHNSRYLLRENERIEWELIGGKLEPYEALTSCVAREILEEAGIIVQATNLLDAWLYSPSIGVNVIILTYECKIEKITLPVISPENATLSWFTGKEIEQLNMPVGYKNSIRNYQLKLLAR